MTTPEVAKLLDLGLDRLSYALRHRRIPGVSTPSTRWVRKTWTWPDVEKVAAYFGVPCPRPETELVS